MRRPAALPQHRRRGGLLAVGAGRDAEGLAINAGEMLQRGEAGADRHFGDAKISLLQQLMGLGETLQQVMPHHRRSQVMLEMALQLPGTGMTVTADLDSTGSLQPQDLDEIARRLMLSAEGIAYGKKNVIFTGPLFESMKAHGDKMHVMFSEANTGLIVKGDGELKGFAIAGEDNTFFPAHAETDGKKIVVWSEQVPHPAAVRYGWADNPFGMNLYNRDILFKDGLPAPPFAGRAKIRKK